LTSSRRCAVAGPEHWGYAARRPRGRYRHPRAEEPCRRLEGSLWQRARSAEDVIRKFFLNVSKKEHERRFLERLEEPQKNWKFSKGKLRELGAAKQGLLAGK
jgi:hypothetical protein